MQNEIMVILFVSLVALAAFGVVSSLLLEWASQGAARKIKARRQAVACWGITLTLIICIAVPVTVSFSLYV